MGKPINSIDAVKVHLDGVGQVLLERSRRARHIRLSVRPFKGVRIAVPQGVSYDQALDAARSKAGWIIKHLGRMARIEQGAVNFQRLAPINRAVARRVIVERLATLARRHGFGYNKVFVRNQKTRWGSCSSADNISLNVNLIRLPRELMDYVILHELVHTRILDHGPRFWRELGRYVPDPRGAKRRLSAHDRIILS